MSLRQRKGSALLVVLGMVAFIVISAVAFSAYMRYSRAPSSFLRQTIASRMIVKAALAEAISEVDEAIGNNPHPNIGHNSVNYQYINNQGYSAVAGTNNYWRGRVLVGDDNDLPDYDDTVATLTYEGLAYIPPALVNEARYYSRHANTAIWRSLDFDVGRYAFCAIDVSDFFDVNIMSAALPRSSAANSRITLNYLFDSSSEAESWENLVDQYRECDEDAGTISLGKKVPLISVADMNLAMGKSSYGGFQSPFCLYDHQTTLNFYGDETRAEDAAAMTFVTDGWYPSSKRDNNVYDLADAQYQPFTSAELDNATPNYYQITESASLMSQRILQYAPNIALAALYDYLDEDRVPLSLGIPTLERVPMICGIEPTFNGTLQVEQEKNGAPAPGNDDTYDPEDYSQVTVRKAKRTLVFKLKTDNFFGSMPSIKALATYPFRHDDKVPASGFTVDGGIAVFFTTGAMGLRPRNAVDRLRFTSDTLFTAATGSGAIGNGVILLPFAQQSLSFSSISSQESAVKEVTLSADPSSAASELAKDDYALLSITYEWTQNDITDRKKAPAWTTVDKPEPSNDDVTEAFCGLKPLQDNGAVESIYNQKDASLVSAIESAGHTWTLNVAPFVRIKYQGKTVDMVPACGENDNINGGNNWSVPESQILLQDYYGEASPLLRFDTGASFVFNLAGLAAANSAKTETISPKAILVGDPRFNYAPESWFGYAAGGITPSIWLSENGAADNDGDIFMQVSDQGYMQSIYELANITRFGTSGFGSFGDEEYGHMKKPRNYGVDNSFATSKSDTEHIANQHLMWRTYDPFGRYLDGGDKFEQLKVVNDGTGYKVNPYSDSTNIMMAAFMNTPHDWRCASTNNLELDGVSADQFNKNYAWTEDSSGAKLSDLDCQLVAGNLMLRMHQGTVKDWEDEWDDMWDFDSSSSGNSVSTLCGLPLNGSSDLYNTDKKFLYGYWRDCFATRQQLFLVFVRAEPCMMGGGAAGITPPQLGARAVALVWRDPNENPNDNTLPHKTRILFYRQFD